MLDLTAAAEVERAAVRRRRPVSVRSARQHRLDRQAAGRAGEEGSLARAGGRLGRRAGLAADGRRLGDGRRRGPRAVPHASSQRLPHRPHAAAARHPAVRRRADRLGLLADRVGAEPEGEHAAHRRHVPPGVRHRRGVRRAARGRGRNLLGRHAQRAADGRAAGSRRTGRRRSAFRPTWPTRCCS